MAFKAGWRLAKKKLYNRDDYKNADSATRKSLEEAAYNEHSHRYSSHHRKTIDFITRKVTAEFTIASEHLQNGFGEVLQTLWTECHRRMRNHSNWSKSQMTKFRDV
ncbi:hypothetical protein FPSE_04841 [Fusarium pseudograminearum CS3096]|uniref:Uncharacterized protein n=1 Tax=Fusarium pseudograminearum (strain CS3096) TaxID=1028729 RepID=K3VKC7_FUSPC|nr:hypothetical protein FPSE_04841 [Fusarium pseudograminearum CS3096]EKJ74949.1 hypothetical protein FPSE_04841 [Fusarium pseudograminearum CS3096]